MQALFQLNINIFLFIDFLVANKNNSLHYHLINREAKC